MIRAILIALLVLNAIDIAIHVGADRIEPIRITSNILVMLAALVAMGSSRPGIGRAAVFAGGVAYAALNAWFVVTSGIGFVGIGLIVSTIGLVTAFLLTRRVPQEEV